jgi:uncharacterized caspase-like protein
VKEGDTVLFFYSGHGLGVEANNTNYLLLGDIKSLRTYTRGQVIEADRRRDDLISLKMPSFEGAYETDEIAKNGVSVTDVMNEIAAKKPKVSILFLDACRSIIRATTDEREIKRGVSSGSRLLPTKDLPAGSIVVFSASFGETAIESFGYAIIGATPFSPRSSGRSCNGLGRRWLNLASGSAAWFGPSR